MTVAKETGRGAETMVDIEGDPFHHLVFENEQVRVFRVEIPPGRETLMHRHERAFVTVALGDGKVRDQRLGGEPAVKGWESGQPGFAEGGFAHSVRNLGSEPFRAVVVEVKR